jgi:thiamine pyrophosphokinase
MTPRDDHAFIVCNGFRELPDAWRDELAATAVVAADGGADRLHDLGVTPRAIIGDLDSIRPDVLANFRGKCEILESPVAKNETDAELALRWCAGQGFRDVTVLNPMDGRFDHCLGALALLEYALELGLTARIRSGSARIRLVSGRISDEAPAGMTLSLVPVSGTVMQVRTEGLLYPLRDETLYRAHTRGVSNQTLGGPYVVTHGEGRLLIITGEV